MTKKRTYTIKCIHETQVTYQLDADSFDEALGKLCNKEIWTEFASGYFGPDDDVLERERIRVVETDTFGDPSPTGRYGMYGRDWEYKEDTSWGLVARIKNEKEEGERRRRKKNEDNTL